MALAWALRAGKRGSGLRRGAVSGERGRPGEMGRRPMKQILRPKLRKKWKSKFLRITSYNL
uniref:Uncharacterized protein n=1 Tax=Arundo donax TaxID=35708 RepID=A0A0A8Z922_ARUDO